MTQRYHNPFAAVDLVAPIEQRTDYQYFTQSGGNAIIDQSPFPRMVDLWFAGFSIAARKQLSPIDLSKLETFKFIDGSIFDRDSWRVQTVMLVAIAVEDKIEIVTKPHQMISIANGLAAAGVPHIVEMMREGAQDPIWNLSDSVYELLNTE